MIPLLVAEPIVDLLETIDVDHSEHQIPEIPSAENSIHLREEMLVIQQPRQPVDVRHEVVVITLQIVPHPLLMKEICEKPGDQKKRKRIQDIPRGSLRRLHHVRTDINNQELSHRFVTICIFSDANSILLFSSITHFSSHHS